jgi:hypothetical protein
MWQIQNRQMETIMRGTKSLNRKLAFWKYNVYHRRLNIPFQLSIQITNLNAIRLEDTSLAWVSLQKCKPQQRVVHKPPLLLHASQCPGWARGRGCSWTILDYNPLSHSIFIILLLAMSTLLECYTGYKMRNTSLVLKEVIIK